MYFLDGFKKDAVSGDVIFNRDYDFNHFITGRLIRRNIYNPALAVRSYGDDMLFNENVIVGLCPGGVGVTAGKAKDF